jgi:mitochondrial chaperone BCS1
MFETIAHLLEHSPIIGGGLALGLGGTAIATLRDVPAQALDAIKRQGIISVEVRSNDELFRQLTCWLDQLPSMRSARKLTASIDWGEEGVGERVVYSPAPGQHLVRYDGRLIWLSRVREEKSDRGVPSETITVKILGRDPAVIRALFENVRRSNQRRAATMVRVLMGIGDCWERVAEKAPRPLASVILPDGAAQATLADMTEFLASRSWYTDRGLPYRRGYLLFGPPGSGKSSLAFALASELGMDLFVLNLAAPKLDDMGLALLMRRVSPKGILLIEDVDAAFAERTKATDDASHVTFSGLLNALDGVGSRDGQITMMSTNHIERLDPALIRPGRIDHRLFLGNARRSQAAELFQRFFPESDLAGAFAERVGDDVLSMAALQQHLVAHRSDPRAAVEGVAIDLRRAA